MNDFLMSIINNPVDIIIFVIIIFFATLGARRGFIIFALRGCSKIVSMGVSFLTYPFIASLVRKTFIFDTISEAVKNSLNLQNTATSTQQQQIDAINALSLPQPVKTMLLDNNNSVIHSILNVQTGVADYISRFIANIILNIAVGFIMFFVISFVMRTIMKMGRFISKLPVIGSINSLAGGVLGLFAGVVFVWVVFTAMNIFIANDFFTSLNNSIYASHLGKYLYDNNIIWSVIKTNLFR